MVNCYNPKSLKEALNIRKNKSVILFAGGTDLMIKMKSWSGLSPKFEQDLLFIGHLKELRNIKYKNGCLKIGAACTLTEIIESKVVPYYIKDIVSNMASPAVRNIATIGGNICNSSPAGDILPLLYALNTRLILESVDGKREINIEDFIYDPGKNNLRENELLIEILINLEEFNIVCHRKVGTRKANSISKASFIGFANISNKKIEDIRIAFGAVAKTIVRCRDIEERLKGMNDKDITDNLLKIKESYSNLINSIDDQRSDKEYREKISIKLLESFLLRELKL